MCKVYNYKFKYSKHLRDISGDKISSSAAKRRELILRLLSDNPHAAPL